MSSPPTVPNPIKTFSDTLVGTPDPSSGDGEPAGDAGSVVLAPGLAAGEAEWGLEEECDVFEGAGLGLGGGLGEGLGGGLGAGLGGGLGLG